MLFVISYHTIVVGRFFRVEKDTWVCEKSFKTDFCFWRGNKYIILNDSNEVRLVMQEGRYNHNEAEHLEICRFWQTLFVFLHWTRSRACNTWKKENSWHKKTFVFNISIFSKRTFTKYKTLISQTKPIVIDEAPMQQKETIEYVEHAQTIFKTISMSNISSRFQMPYLTKYGRWKVQNFKNKRYANVWCSLTSLWLYFELKTKLYTNNYIAASNASGHFLVY